MGEFVYGMSGSDSPIIKKLDIGANFSNAGIFAEAPNANDAGVTPCTTTAAADVMGITLDTATYVTAQQTDGTSARRVVSVIVNGDGVYRFIASGGATEGTALTLATVTTANTAGTAVICSATDFTSPASDEGALVCYTGPNAGQVRKITTEASGTATVTVPFDYDTVVGDTFYRFPWWPGDTTAKTVQVTTNLYQADANGAVGTGVAAVIVELEAYDLAGEGRSKSAVLFMSNDHVFQTATA